MSVVIWNAKHDHILIGPGKTPESEGQSVVTRVGPKSNYIGGSEM